MSRLHIEYVRNSIDERYAGLQSEHRIGPRAASACVFGGADDRGLDAGTDTETGPVEP